MRVGTINLTPIGDVDEEFYVSEFIERPYGVEIVVSEQSSHTRFRVGFADAYEDEGFEIGNYVLIPWSQIRSVVINDDDDDVPPTTENEGTA